MRDLEGPVLRQGTDNVASRAREHRSNRPRQYPVSGHSRGVDHARCARHRAGLRQRSADHLLPGMLRPRLSRTSASPCRLPTPRSSNARGPSSPSQPNGPTSPSFLERNALVDGALVATALVINADGSIAGFQDKVQIDPSEEGTYTPGSGRRIFQAGPLTFGIAICHEGWRYPETVRWAARRGAQVVFHPHFHEAEPGSYRPTAFADPANTFHEKAALCRAAENTCYFATVNFASPGSPTTSAIVRPDGTAARLPALR